MQYSGKYDGTGIKGTWSIGDYSGKFKLTKLLDIHIHKPYLSVKLPEGQVSASHHPHPLTGPETRDSGWKCDGSTIYTKKCQGGLNDFYKSDGHPEYRCASCGFDSCLECTQY